MYKNRIICCLLALAVLFSVIVPVHTTYAASIDNVLNTLTSSTVATSDATSGGGNVIDKLFSFLFDKLLGPVLHIFGGGKSVPTTGNAPVKVIPLPDSSGSLSGKTIVIDPGHGGSNPGAVANNGRESDNNLAVGLKVRDKLVQAGAKVIMTRSSDRTVAPEGSSLGEELQARLDIANANKADAFVSIHTNDNPDPSIEGTMTFYPSGKSDTLARAVQAGIIAQTNATDKGVSPATFYVLRNATMPSILVEMGFISNQAEAARLSSNDYRDKIAQGIVDGLANYFSNN